MPQDSSSLKTGHAKLVRKPKHFSTVVVGLRVLSRCFETDGFHVPSTLSDGPSEPVACPVLGESEVALESSPVKGDSGLESGLSILSKGTPNSQTKLT